MFDYDSEDDSDYGSEDDDDDNVFAEKAINQQNAFGINVYSHGINAKRDAKEEREFQKKSIKELNAMDVEREKEPKTTFNLAINAGQQGIAYLILDNGFDYMIAM